MGYSFVKFYAPWFCSRLRRYINYLLTYFFYLPTPRTCCFREEEKKWRKFSGKQHNFKTTIWKTRTKKGRFSLRRTACQRWIFYYLFCFFKNLLLLSSVNFIVNELDDIWLTSVHNLFSHNTQLTVMAVCLLFIYSCDLNLFPLQFRTSFFLVLQC